jgi:hypothetical protein
MLGVLVFFINIDKNLSQIQRELSERRVASTTRVA